MELGLRLLRRGTPCLVLLSRGGGVQAQTDSGSASTSQSWGPTALPHSPLPAFLSPSSFLSADSHPEPADRGNMSFPASQSGVEMGRKLRGSSVVTSTLDSVRVANGDTVS